MIFAVLYFFLADRLKQFPGITFLLYLALYSLGRMLIEILRTDSIMGTWFGHLLPIPIVASVISLIVSIVAIALLMTKYLRPRKS